MGEGVLEGQEEGEREEKEGQGVPRKRDLGDLAKVCSSACISERPFMESQFGIRNPDPDFAFLYAMRIL